MQIDQAFQGPILVYFIKYYIINQTFFFKSAHGFSTKSLSSSEFK